MNMSDTVAAVSTPRGVGGIAVIRVSGELTRRVLSRVFRPVGKISPADAPRRAVYGSIISPVTGRETDRGLVTFFAAPASYTGEDMAEISCHGGAYVTKEVLAAVLAAGCRPAEGGEFTRRAFVMGKLSLTEAEAVGEMLEADTADRLALAADALSGRLSDSVHEIGESLADAMSALYAEIDYPEEELAGMTHAEIAEAISCARGKIASLLATYKRGRAVSQGVKCVICGSPNVGKSSLYNLMSGHDAAIVTDTEGTTRDVLRERVAFGGVTLELCDTAGLRETDDRIEKIGVSRARAELADAELVLAVFDGTRHLTESERQSVTSYDPSLAIAVINKSELDCALDASELSFIRAHHARTVSISCLTEDGADALEAAIGELFDTGACRIGEEAVIWSARQRAALAASDELLGEAAATLAEGCPTDAVCTLLEGALGELMSTDGRGVSEELVARVFSKFCVGK